MSPRWNKPCHIHHLGSPQHDEEAGCVSHPLVPGGSRTSGGGGVTACSCVSKALAWKRVPLSHHFMLLFLHLRWMYLVVYHTTTMTGDVVYCLLGHPDLPFYFAFPISLYFTFMPLGIHTLIPTLQHPDIEAQVQFLHPSCCLPHHHLSTDVSLHVSWGRIDMLIN